MVKKFITLIMLLSLSVLAQSNLKNLDSIGYNSVLPTDIMGIQKQISGDFIWHKISMYALERNFRESILGKSNIWTQSNRFNQFIRTNDVLPNAHDTYWLGYWQTFRWAAIFSKTGYFETINLIPVGNPDSSSGTNINYDGVNIIVGKSIVPKDSASQSFGSKTKPMDTSYVQAISAPYDLGLIAQDSEGSSISPPDSIWKNGVLAKPGILHYSQTYLVDGSTTSLRVKSEIINLNVSAPGGRIDTLYIGEEIISGLGVPIVTIYHYGGDSFKITDTDGSGYKFCIRAEDDIILERYGSVRLMLDKNIEQWIVIGVYNAD